MTTHKDKFSVDIEKRAARVRSQPIPNIIKEAISNSLDADATTIAISCKRAEGKRRDGDGLRAFEVTCTDNGAGCDDPEILRRVGSTTSDLHAERRGRFGQGTINIIVGVAQAAGHREPRFLPTLSYRARMIRQRPHRSNRSVVPLVLLCGLSTAWTLEEHRLR